MTTSDEAAQWQVGIWDKISDLYSSEIDARFEGVVSEVIETAKLRPGESVLDLGTGTGSVALEALSLVGPTGQVVGVDVSNEMLSIARKRAVDHGLGSVRFLEGRAEDLPLEPDSIDVLIASLSFMYVIDREAAGIECARVLKPKGRFVAAVWGPADSCDIVLFQSTAGSFAPAPPVPGVGPGALADPTGFLKQLADAGIEARVVGRTTEFEFPTFDLAWDVLAGVTTADLSPERTAEAKTAVQHLMWPEPDLPKRFSNLTKLILGSKT